MKKEARVIINEDWCKSCEICVRFCPRKVFKMGKFYPQIVNIEKCTACKLCELLCPDFAITVIKPGEEKTTEQS